MPYIENISIRQIEKADHWNRGQDSVLIQIVNPGFKFPKPQVKFLEVHQFEILDAEDRDSHFIDEVKFSKMQASKIIDILLDAARQDRNVTVHCHMGISRSGAVALIGSFIGFDLRTNNQVPNMRMMKYLELELHTRDYRGDI